MVGSLRGQSRQVCIHEKGAENLESLPRADVHLATSHACQLAPLTRSARVGNVDSSLLSSLQDIGVISALDGMGACSLDLRQADG